MTRSPACDRLDKVEVAAELCEYGKAANDMNTKSRCVQIDTSLEGRAQDRIYA